MKLSRAERVTLELNGRGSKIHLICELMEELDAMRAERERIRDKETFLERVGRKTELGR